MHVCVCVCVFFTKFNRTVFLESSSANNLRLHLYLQLYEVRFKQAEFKIS